MNTQKNFTFVLTVIVASSCHSSEKSDSLEKYKVTEVSTLNLGFEEELKKIGEFTLPLDDLSTYELYNVRYFESGEEESLYVLNNLNTSIDIYSLNNEKLIKRIDYQTEGPEGIGQVQGFTVANEDSVFLFPKFKLTGSLLLDRNGNMINRYNPDIDDPEIKGHINHISGNSNQTYFFGNKLFFHRYAFFKVDDPGFIYDFSFDIVSGETRWLTFATLPNKYLEKDWFSPYFTDSRLALNENEWVYSWRVLDSLIYIRDEYGKKLGNCTMSGMRQW